MTKKHTTDAPPEDASAIVEWLGQFGGWTSRKAIIKAVRMNEAKVKKLLVDLVARKAIQVAGERAGTRYAALGIDTDAKPESRERRQAPPRGSRRCPHPRTARSASAISATAPFMSTARSAKVC